MYPSFLTDGIFKLNAVDFALGALLIVSMGIGLAQGIIRQCLTLMAFYFSLVLAAQYYPHVGRALSPWLVQDTTIRATFALAGTFFLIAFILNWLTHYIYQETRIAGFTWGDRLGGAGLGLAWGGAFSGVILTILSFGLGTRWMGWEQNQRDLSYLLADSPLARLITSWLPYLYGTLSPWLPLGLPVPFF